MKVLAALALASCSYVVRPPEPGPPEHWVPCIENRFFPALDTTAAVGYSVLLGYGAYWASQQHGSDAYGAPVLAIMVPVTALAFGLSAYRGFKVTGQCRDRHREYDKLVGP